MYKKLLEHEKLVKAEIEQINQKLKDTGGRQGILSTRKATMDLNDYHQKTVYNFQHERLIHLIVTFFFVGLLILSIVSMFLLASLPINCSYLLLNTLISVVILILFVTDIFYIHHYYQLENGTQRLYDLSEKLYGLINKIDNNTLQGIDTQS
jgi:uncharacterized Tic20 family protein